jgi:hypothetical protein
MSAITKEERERLPLHVFAVPSIRSLPILDQEDLTTAIRRLPFVQGDKNEVRARIVAIAQNRGLELPENWRLNVMSATEVTSDNDMDAANDAEAREYGRELAEKMNREQGRSDPKRGDRVERDSEEDDDIAEARAEARALANRVNRQHEANDRALREGRTGA